MMSKLYYAYDPMCSWCYAFRPMLEALIAKLPTQLEIVPLLGGLAADSNEPMSEEMQIYVQSNWRRIEDQVPKTKFNFDFWKDCKPKRSTYPACRAVIAARKQGAEYDLEMIWAIQQAYYQQARNPSELSTLCELAVEIGLDKDKFLEDIKSNDTNEALMLEINQTRQLGMTSFPSLLLELEDQLFGIEPDYLNIDSMLVNISEFFISNDIT